MSPDTPTSPFKRSRTQELKWEALLDIASALFNEKGQTATSLQEVADRLKVSKRTVYNYVANKDELVYHCYTRTVGSGLRILKEVMAGSDSGLTKIRAYVHGQLDDQLPPFAVVTEINSLSPERAGQIRTDARQCRVFLQQIVNEGIEDGSIVNCNAALTAMAIFSIISWVPMWFSRSGSLSLVEVASTFEDVLVHGLRPIDAAPWSRSNLESLPLARPPSRKRDIGEIKKEALLKAATRLFNRNGIAGTSVDDVVGSLDVTKGVAYYYFDNKEDLLGGCYERSLDTAEILLDEIESHTTDPMKRLYLYLHYFSLAHAGARGPMMIFAGLENLSDELRHKIVTRGRQLERRTEQWLRVGMATGAVREVNPLLARYVFIGAMDSLPKWYRAGGANTPRDIADGFFKIFSEGLQPRQGSDTKAGITIFK